jgi:phosphodiesterase/alkaline phosphatase D-like protein
MKKTVVTLLMLFALGSWSVAQTETQKNDTNKSSSANGIESGPTVDASDHSATIRWKTDDKAATIVKYGTDKNNLSKQARHSGGSRDHNVTLAELQPGTKYFYQIQKTSGEVRAEGEFTTKGAGESASGGSNGGSQGGSKSEDRVVITEGPTVQPGPDGTAKIVWKTDDIAATDVKYGTDANNPKERAFKPGGSRDHQADLKGLQAGQTYHYQVLRRDGSVRTTGQFQYQPQSAATLPATPGQTGAGQASSVQISAGPWLDTVADKNAIITWKTNVPSNSVVKYGTDRNALNQTATGDWGTDHVVSIQGLNPNATYYFQTYSTQAAGQTAAVSNVGAFQTVAPGTQAKKNPPIVH